MGSLSNHGANKDAWVNEQGCLCSLCHHFAPLLTQEAKMEWNCLA